MSHSFDKKLFSRGLQTTWLGSETVYIEETASTNNFLKEISGEELLHGMVVVTDNQTRGRGQYERRWHTEPGRNLTFTVAFRPREATRLNLLSLASAYAVSRAIELYLEQKVTIKWPNDLMVGDKKLGGLLTESVFNGNQPDRVLIGIGVNVNQEKFDAKLHDNAVSMCMLADEPISRERLLCDILIEMEQMYHEWERELSSLRESVCAKMIGYGEWVRISVNGELIEGTFKFIGIGKYGELLMLNEQLDVNTFRYEQVRIITGHQGVSPANERTSS